MNMKKLFLLNLPYLLFVYPFDKLAQAFRLAPGSDLSGKLLSIGDRKRQEEGVWLTEEMHGRKERKNQTKILLYHMLQKRTGQELPWGTLTGVRPTKIPMALIDAGHSNVETAKIMRECFGLSD